MAVNTGPAHRERPQEPALHPRSGVHPRHGRCLEPRHRRGVRCPQSLAAALSPQTHRLPRAGALPGLDPGGGAAGSGAAADAAPHPAVPGALCLHRDPVEEVLQAAVAAPGFGLHALFVAEWDGAGSLQVLAAEGRTPQLPLEPGDARCQLRRRRAYLIVAEHWRRRPAAGRGDGPGDGPCRPGPLRR